MDFASTPASDKEVLALPPYYESGRRAALQYAQDEGWEPCTLEEYRVWWDDQDRNGHVNNKHYFKWMDAGRTKLLSTFAEPPKDNGTGSGVGMILASQKCDYLSSVTYPDHILIATRIKNGGIGIKKQILEHVMWSYKQQAPVAYGESIVVLFDFTNHRAVTIPEGFNNEARQREWKGKPLGWREKKL